MTISFKVEANGMAARLYFCSTATVAAKKFLNYLRRYKIGRPTLLKIQNEKGEHFLAEVSWYTGKLKHGSFKGADGEWWKLEVVRKWTQSKLC